MHQGVRFNISFDNACDEIRLEIYRAENFFGSLIFTRLIDGQ